MDVLEIDVFGERLKSLRESKDMTQEELGKVLHLSQSMIAHYEANRKQPGRQTMKKISQFFNVSTDYLFGLTDDPAPPQSTQDTFPLHESEELTAEEIKEVKAIRNMDERKYRIFKILLENDEHLATIE